MNSVVNIRALVAYDEMEDVEVEYLKKCEDS